jgi:hypothetical protein
MNTEVSAITIKELRCSLVWVSLFTTPGILDKKKDYVAKFETIAAGSDDKWSLPWLQKKPRIVFWERYLETETPLLLDPEKAARCVVPLRTKNLGKIYLPANGHTTDEEVSSWIEGFAYPHGVACIITLRWRSKIGLALEKAVDRLIELRNTKFCWSRPTPALKEEKILKDISCGALDYLSSEIVGGKLQNAQNDPYTVVTVVEAENVPLEGGELDEGKLLHKSLDALCVLTRRRIKPSNLIDALLATKGVDDDVLYARGLGRVVWLPGFFREHWQSSQQQASNEHKPIRFLGPYHRNLTLATMQTAYLSIFLHWIYRSYRSLGRALRDNDLLNWEKAAAGAIARLYGKCKKSYMSSSLPQQIVMGNFLVPINASRRFHQPQGHQLGGQPYHFKKHVK